ncbi:conserved membrane hypothetical protein [[Clostridium] ultunense Esp]|nr:conserved membrane hypothetical protein [[Clostridium] ultunense Esp]
MGKGQSLTNVGIKAVLAFLLMLIGMEWIHTLPFFTDTEASYLYLFDTIIGVTLLLSWIFPWVWLRFLTSLLFMFYWFQVYRGEGEKWPDWWFSLWGEVRGAIPAILGLRLDQLNADLRTGFFFLFLTLLSLTLYREVVEKGRILFFLLLSFIWIGVLDTFFLFDGSLPTIRLFLYSFFLLAIQTLRKNPVFLSSKGKGRDLIPWAGLLLTLLLLFSGIGLISPKAAPSWPDPVSFLQTLKEDPGSGTGGVQVSGYGKDDSRLGGGFVQSDEVVFTAKVDGDLYPSHYWRGESKDTYTGQGWVKEMPDEIQPLSNGKIMDRLFNPVSLPMKNLRETVTFQQPGEILFTSGQPLQIIPQFKPDAGKSGGVQFDAASYALSSKTPVATYLSISQIPVIDEKRLIQVSDLLLQGSASYPDWTAPYLQLPDSLPARVKELAAKVVGEEKNAYKKAKKIEGFLRWGNIYRYETQDVPFPAEGQDFVDQFLFETKRGYCDHFSSAMVVMLRSQGIPARWVKGYAFGELKRNDRGELETTVRQKDAHSWVEAYFPEVGWVPFEATASFFTPYEMVRESTGSATAGAADDPAMEEMPKPEELEKMKAALTDVEGKQAQETKGESVSSPGVSFPIRFLFLPISFLLFLLLLLVVVLNRDRLLFWWRTRGLNRNGESHFIVEFYRSSFPSTNAWFPDLPMRRCGNMPEFFP